MSIFVKSILLVFLSTPAWAGESLYFGIRHQFESVRALGMGNAFVGVADDNNAIFYNPAGLGQLTEGESNWFLKFDGDPEIAQLVGDIQDASDNPPAGQSEEDALTEVIQKNYGSHYSLRMPSLGWLWARPNWGLAVIASDFSMDIGLHRTVGPSVNLVAINDTTVALSYNWEIEKFNYGTLNFGITGKAIYRLEANKIISVTELSKDSEIFKPEDAREGFTADADLGFLWISPWENWQLSSGLVVRNVLDYGFAVQWSLIGDESGKPDNLGRVIDIGFGLKLPSWWVFKNKLAFDMRDMLHENHDFVKSMHLGYEASWSLASWFQGAWRLGINQGYWTAGFTGEFAVFRLDIASYAEEVGVPGSTIENRRYMVMTSLDF